MRIRNKKVEHIWKEIPGWPRYQIDQNGEVLFLSEVKKGNNDCFKEAMACKKTGIRSMTLARKGEYRRIPVETLLLVTHGPEAMARYRERFKRHNNDTELSSVTELDFIYKQVIS